MKRFVFFGLPWLLLGSLVVATLFFLRTREALAQAERARAAEMQARAQIDLAARDSSSTPSIFVASASNVGDAQKNAVACCVSAMPLSSEQMSKLNTTCSDCCAEMMALEKSTDAVLASLEAAIAEKTIDRAKVDELVDRLCEARRSELKKRVDSILLVRDVLDPAQIEMLRNAVHGLR